MIPMNWQYILVMIAVTYLIRVLPMTLVRREIRNPIIRSFLYYVPYVTLAVMMLGPFRAPSSPPETPVPKKSMPLAASSCWRRAVSS